MKKNQAITILNIFGIKNLDDIETVSSQLNQIDIDTKDSGGRTLLMEAAIWGKHDLLKLLIQRGADTNIREERNWTALHFAAQAYDLFSVKMLVENGADINARNDFGNNIVWIAAMNSQGRGEVLQFLISNGADFNAKNDSGISAKDLAFSISNFDVRQFFEE